MAAASVATAPVGGNDYGAAYWTQRHQRPQPDEDWYGLSYDTGLKAVLAPYLSADAEFEILIPGCGTSSLPASLYRDGFTNVSCVDACESVIQRMAESHAALSDMDFSVLNATDLKDALPDGCFDLVSGSKQHTGLNLEPAELVWC